MIMTYHSFPPQQRTLPFQHFCHPYLFAKEFHLLCISILLIITSERIIEPTREHALGVIWLHTT
jgi:hypothetical protein